MFINLSGKEFKSLSHAELVSASQETLKRVQGDYLLQFECSRERTL